MKTLYRIVFLVFAGCIPAYAQDLHWAQPSGTLLYQNPAFTGITDKFSASLNYRNQWSALNTSFSSYMFSGDYRFGKKEKKASLAVGVIFYQDVAGVGNLRTTNGGLNLSCLLKLNRNLKFGTGMGFNMVQKSMRLNNFTWGSQFDGYSYNPSYSSRENKPYSSAAFADLNAGIALAYDNGSGSFASSAKTKFVVGYSISHYNRPNQSVLGGNEPLDMKHTFYAQGIFNVKDNLALKPSLLFYYQSEMIEAVAGFILRRSLGQQSKITGIKKGAAFGMGVLYRYKDAIIPVVEIEKGNVLFGITYDVNVSKLSPSTRLRGGIELSIRLTNYADYLYQNRN